MSQLKAVLWKNWLLKAANPKGTAAELLLPVAFMALLILIKSITNQYDSPNIAYYCGNAFPWYYEDGSSLNVSNIASSPLLQCLEKPSVCSADNYYKSGFTLTSLDDKGDDSISIYSQYGYVDSSASFGVSTNPFYTFTIGDESELYSKTNLDNPSLPLLSIMQRLSRNGVLLALAPGDFSNELYSQVQNISSYILIQTGGLYGESIKLFDSKDQMDDYMTDRHYDDDGYGEGKIGLAILLYQADVENMQWNYAVRTNFTYVWEQEDDDPSCLYGQGNGTCDFTYCTPTTKEYTQDLYKPQSMEFIYGYSFSGFSTLQITMDSYIFSQYSSTVNIMASIGLMPTEDYETDDFQYVISSTLGIFYMLSFLYPVSRMIRSLVLEKEQKIKEGMKMMGLTDFAYNLSWLITTVTQMTVVSGLIVLVTMTSVFEYSNSFLVFVYFMAFSLAVINMCFLMATCFSKSKIASLMGPMIFFATFFPYYAVQDPAYSPQVKAATCLLAPSCFALGANVFADFEGGLVGVQMSNFSQETSNFSYSLCVGMMLVDAVLYGILAWYFDKVIPSEYGTQLPLYFPILPSYWCGVEIVKKDQVLEQPLLTHSNEDSSKVEVVSEELKAQEEDGKCLIIRNLRKVFKTTAEDRVAVDCLNLNVYEGQVTVLLGHNGAGKSTTISMLTGLINPSAGDATIQGQFLSSNLQNIRKSLGVCPQHDILFPEMTVLQHLEMFAIFKGVDSSKVNDAAMKMIREVGLKEKTNYQSCMLSGGQKRKLSLGIALIGDSKVIILDEPTSGMDPYSRRSTWNIIQRNRKGRIILMTTHFMDEADLLGDRIAIMGEGRLRCVGSSMFLKKVYGVGYTFTVVRSAQGVGGEPVVDLVTSHVPEADVLSNVGAEQSFRLPFSASAKFVELFTETESKKQELGISEYGISVTTLEEVFIRVGKNTEDITTRESIVKFAEENEQRRSMSLSNNDDGDDIKIAMKLLPNDNDGNLFANHFRALFLKRYIYGKRDMRMLFCQVILPVMLVVLGLGLLQLRPGFDQVELVLTPAKLNPDLSAVHRNYVPFNSLGGSFSGEMMSRFNGDTDNSNDDVDGGGVYGIAIPIKSTDDQFQECSSGAAPLFNMSNFALVNSEMDGQDGSSHYGTVTIAEDTTAEQLNYNVLVNGSSMHGAGIYVNLVHESFLQVMAGNGKANIIANNYPLPRTWKQDNNEASIDAFTAALFFMIAFCFIPASYVSFIVKEREVKAKHQQIISGVSIYAYWCSSWLWDVVSYLPTVVLVFCIVLGFGIESYTQHEGAIATVLLFVLFGPAVASFTYLTSFFFKSHSTAQLVIMFGNFLTGLCLMIVSFVLSSINSTQSLAVDLRYLFRLFPAFCLGDGLTQLALCDSGSSCPSIGREGYDFDNTVAPLSWNIVGANLVFLGAEAVIYFVLTILVEYSLTFPTLLSFLQRVNDDGFDKEKELPREDKDVFAERCRVDEGWADCDVVKLHEMRKVYNTKVGPKVAVQSLSFGIPRGECFGFLGINGAGKTTTLSILSGEFPPTVGEAYIDGFSIKEDQTKIRKKIGYCPQFDALLELLTVREHLELYARIKGINPAQLDDVVDGKITQMDLRDFEHKAAGTLSGGNKRKLSVAIAMIGDPSIIFLDEPSTGMDPVARRFMWEVISRISTQDALCSIILTTHSMEEAEALCTRIGIMVNGRLSCLGSSQHLKLRFGNGYEVDFKMRLPTASSLQSIWHALEQAGVDSYATNDSVHAVKGEDGGNHIYKNLRLRGPLSILCDALLESERQHLFAPGRDGEALYHAFEADGYLSSHAFLEWWVAQNQAEQLSRFMEKSFPESVLLERSSAFSFRYRITTPDIPLAQVFSNFEGAKSSLCIEDYSVGQTTLEQIFNQFASSQDNPENASGQPLASKVSTDYDDSTDGDAFNRTNTLGITNPLSTSDVHVK